MTNWEKQSISYTIKAHRTGWAGVWDAVKAAITGDHRPTIRQDLTLSLWIKPIGAEVADVSLTVMNPEDYQ